MDFCAMHYPTMAASALLASVIIMNSCKHGQCDPGPDSKHGGSRSHNMGRDCASCHHADGPGEVCWLVGGTAYDSLTLQPSPNVTVRLFTQPGGAGDERMTLEGDALGNFYTSIDPG